MMQLDTESSKHIRGPRTHDREVEDAVRMRQHIQENIKTKRCAICARLCRKMDISSIASADIPSLDQLIRNGPQRRDEGYPRAGLTFFPIDGIDYCLHPEGCHQSDHVVTVDCCEECLKALSKGSIPYASLVCIDVGPDFVMLKDGTPEPPLTQLENMLVAPWRNHQRLIVCIGKKYKSNQRCETMLISHMS